MAATSNRICASASAGGHSLSSGSPGLLVCLPWPSALAELELEAWRDGGGGRCYDVPR